MSKVVMPCDLAITRFYRIYVEINKDATQDEIEVAVKNKIMGCDNPDAEMMPDPDIYNSIEEHDIVSILPDWDGALPNYEVPNDNETDG